MLYRHCRHREQLAECAEDVKQCCECQDSPTASLATTTDHQPQLNSWTALIRVYTEWMMGTAQKPKTKMLLAGFRRSSSQQLVICLVSQALPHLQSHNNSSLAVWEILLKTCSQYQETDTDNLIHMTIWLPLLLLQHLNLNNLHKLISQHNISLHTKIFTNW